MSQSYVRELLRGTVEPLLLFLISELPIHGYQIIKELESRSQGYFQVTGSTIYSALRRMEEEGMVLSYWQQVAHRQKRRYYVLTDSGRQFLDRKVMEWQKFYSAVEEIVSPAPSRDDHKPRRYVYRPTSP